MSCGRIHDASELEGQPPEDMSLGERQPVRVVELSPDAITAADYFSALIDKGCIAGGWDNGRPDDWRRGMRGEVAFLEVVVNDSELQAAGPLPFRGLPEHAPSDFVIQIEGRAVSLDIHTADHRSLWRKYRRGEPYISYPAQRIETGHLDDYIVGVSVLSDGEQVQVALWGAISRDEVRELIAHAKEQGARPMSGHPDYYPVPLAAFSPDSLMDLLNNHSPTRKPVAPETIDLIVRLTR